MKQPASLTEESSAALGKTLSEEGLAELKMRVSPEVFERVFKNSLLKVATLAPNIWEAVENIKEFAQLFHEEELLNDTALAGRLINVLAQKYSIDLRKVFIKAVFPDITEVDSIERAQGQGVEFSQSNYIFFASKVLDTQGAKKWIENNPQKAPEIFFGTGYLGLANPF